jgi:hypothetical protein
MLEALISKFAQIEDPRCDWRVERKRRLTGTLRAG